MASRRSKRRRSSSSDRISDLPDDVIIRILSLLPTKQAAATSILSKRWLPVWTLLPILDLEDSSGRNSSSLEYGKFTQLVKKVLQSNNAVERLRLRFNTECNSCIYSCLSTATEGDLKELDISGFIPDKIRTSYQRLLPRTFHNSFSWKLPSMFFNGIKMLQVLKLSDAIVVDVPSGVSFPNLKILHLVSVTYKYHHSVCNLLSGCVALEELLFKRRRPKDNGRCYNISIPTLKTLYIESYAGFEANRFEIHAPNLESLNLKNEVLWNKFSGNQLSRLLSSVKSLSLTATSWRYEPDYDCNPLFVNLVRLELIVGSNNWNLLLLFLQSSHILQGLELTLYKGNQNSYGTGDENPLAMPKDVPLCFSSCLETVCLRKFEALEHELQLIEYILTNAGVLKKMTIYTYGSLLDSTSNVRKKLSMIQRCSKTCQLELRRDPNVPCRRPRSYGFSSL